VTRRLLLTRYYQPGGAVADRYTLSKFRELEKPPAAPRSKLVNDEEGAVAAEANGGE
jgi:hypothetical protein